MENERGFTIKDLLIRLVLIVVFIFLLIWLFPMPDLKPLNNQIFAENVDRMKNVAKTYYTIERLPENINDYKKMTLKEMIDNKLILPLMDSNGKYCSEEESYIQITKLENEYVIKVYLSCSDKQDYVIEHFGCYDICSEKCKPSTTTTTAGTPVTNKPVITTKNNGKIYEYQFSKNVCSEKFDKYVCASGYYLAGNKCIKNGSIVDTKPVNQETVKVSTVDTKDAQVVPKTTEVKNPVICKTEYKDSTPINATASVKNVDKVVVKVQKVTADKKYTYDVKGAVGTKKTITADYNIIQNYDVITATKIETYGWKYVSTLTSNRGDLAFSNENEKLVYIRSWLEDECLTCDRKITVYEYWRFKKQVTKTSYSCSKFPGYSLYDTNKCRKATTQTKKCPDGFNDTGSTCQKEEITYSCSKYGADYVLDKDKKVCTKLLKTTYSCPAGTKPTSDEKYCNKDVYGCPSGTNETSDGKCAKTTYKCPDNTSTTTYTLSGTKCNVKTKTTTCPCDGKLSSDKKYCITTSTVNSYSCEKYPGYLKVGSKCIGTITTNKTVNNCKNYDGYVLNAQGNACVKTINTSDTKDAKATYKTVCENQYKWSTNTSINGWTYTGNKREVK